MQFLITSLVSIVVTLASAFGIYNYLPLGVLEYTQPSNKLGSTITTINGSDTISGSRSVINTNFSNLNTDKAEIASANAFTGANTFSALQNFSNASTSLFSCYGPCYFGATATSSFSTAGALTLITPLTVANGGTGSTTLSQFNVLLGSSTNAVGIVAGLGTTGQFLTSNGAGLPPTWQTSAVDTAIAYNWSGLHSFSATTTLATTTITRLGVGTSTPSFTGFSNALNSYFAGGVGIGVSTTSPGNLVVQGLASTTNMVVSKVCTNCVSGYERITDTNHNCSSGVSTCGATATCSAGKKVIGGGFAYTSNNNNVEYANAFPNADNTYTANITCTTNCDSETVTSYAICTNQ